jgi:lysylphosphatidylglycerol synthetase-like protein (DUF2156 family)
MDKFISTLDEYFGKKAPQLPKGVKDFIVKVAPYLAILGIILYCFGLLSVLTFLSPGYRAMMGAYAGIIPMTNVYIALAISTVVAVLYAIAIPGLLKRKKSAWNLVFYSQIISIIGSLINFNLVGLILGVLIGFYVLFQVRSYYTK